jgi:hypothetical protein
MECGPESDESKVIEYCQRLITTANDSYYHRELKGGSLAIRIVSHQTMQVFYKGNKHAEVRKINRHGLPSLLSPSNPIAETHGRESYEIRLWKMPDELITEIEDLASETEQTF